MSTIEYGIAMAIPCRTFTGRPREYQATAKAVMEERMDGCLPWIHIVPACGTALCLTDAHLQAKRAQKIKYPDGVCTYCGMPGFTKDHLQPVTFSGRTKRQFVAVVPACMECNDILGDRIGHRVAERREEVRKQLRKKYRRVLEAPAWTSAQLAELGPILRKHIENGLSKRDLVLHRLSWPNDPSYDLRAFQQSGIENPHDLELI